MLQHNYYYALGEYIGEEVADKQIAYIYGIGLLGEIQNGKAYTTFTNGQGDVVYIQDQENNLVCYCAYDAFGNRIEVLETLYNPMSYRGYYYDEESCDYYLRARYYNPLNGRFMSEDSFRGKYDDPLSLNLYTYAHNSPMYYNDPSGHYVQYTPYIPEILNNLKNAIMAGIAAGAAWWAGDNIGKSLTDTSKKEKSESSKADIEMDKEKGSQPTTFPLEQQRIPIILDPTATSSKTNILDTPVMDASKGMKDRFTYTPKGEQKSLDIKVTPRPASDLNQTKEAYKFLYGQKYVDEEATNTTWERMTAKESKEAAKSLGFEKTNYRAKNGEPIYYNRKTKTYISQDIGSADGSGAHNGGVWKQAKSPEAINSKDTRMGTYDGQLNRIGD